MSEEMVSSLPEGTADAVEVPSTGERVRVTFEGVLSRTGIFDTVQLYFDDGSRGDVLHPYLLRYAKVEPLPPPPTKETT